MKVRGSLACAGGVALITVGLIPLLAQEPGAPKTAEAPAVRKADPSRRVPAYFNQIGLTPEQRDRIYKLQGPHYRQIEDLETQIAAVRARMMAECEGVLTDTQRQLLQERRAATSKSGRGAAPTPARSE